MAKICFVNITVEKISEPYYDLVKQLFPKVLSPGTEVSFKYVEPGMESLAVSSSAYFDLLNKKEIIEKIMEAEKEGFDAALVGCFEDPGVREAQEVVNIPVIGIGEASMLLACMLGNRFGIVTANDNKVVNYLEVLIKLHGLQERAISNPVRTISMTNRETFTKGFQEPHRIVSDVLDKAKGCVADGADIVIVGCAGLGPHCTLSDTTMVDETGAPLLDCVTIGLKAAEAIVDLRSRLGWPAISRAGIYAMPREKDIKRVRGMFGLKSL
jgi:allantoin racemase